MTIWGGDAVWKTKGGKWKEWICKWKYTNRKTELPSSGKNINTPRIKCWQCLMKALGKGVMMNCIPKPTNSFWLVIDVVVFWHYGSFMDTEIIKILCIKVKNREYERAWLIPIWDVTK